MKPAARTRTRLALAAVAMASVCMVRPGLHAARAQAIDPAFNPAPNGFIFAIAVQADGKILIGGTFSAIGVGPGAVPRHNLARLNPDGSVDATFNPGANGSVCALAVQRDGRILVGGDFKALGGGGTGNTARLKLGRLHADGSVDASLEAGADREIDAIALQADGGILVGGEFSALDGGGTGRTPRRGIGRITPDGSVDLAFDPGANGPVYAMAVRPDGGILVGGEFSTLGGGGAGRTPRRGIGRITPDGSVDLTFNPGANGPVYAMAVQPDGRIVIGGSFTTLRGAAGTAVPRYNIARLHADGTLDATFDPGVDSAVLALAVQEDGRVVAGGLFTRMGGGRWGSTTRNGIGRTGADGTLDTAFDPGANSLVRALVVQADGGILVGGEFSALGGGGIDTVPRPYLGRLNPGRGGTGPSVLAPPRPAQVRPLLRDPAGLTGVTATSGIDRPVTIRVLYDNYVKTPGLTSDWGLSLLVEGLDKRVLFDTGAKPDIFGANVKQMKLDLAGVDLLALSHEHGDHTAGVPAFVALRRGVPVLMPAWFTDVFKKRMDDTGLKPVLVDEPALICPHLYSSGAFDHIIPEQALVIDTRDGLVVLTGCSHPGIVEMLRTIKAAFRKNIVMVAGGFHLMGKSDAEMRALIADLKALGVAKCGATHCTGDMQIGMFKSAFGANYVELGVGNAIVIK